ncbi:hypothetical protein Tco_1091474 [Tanacetum coccineum]|uniref:Uncharacterized protein n=1 Tax=Tanacetum coccineum TaxID=301880 RepID=A0ABQ5I740_9ASTR
MLHPQILLQQKTGSGIMTSWREEDLIQEIDLYMPIFQCRLLIFQTSEKDRKLHLSMYGKAAQLEKQMGAKSALVPGKDYSGRTHGGIGCSSSQANCPLTEKELHQLRMDEEALKEMLEEESYEL